MQKYKKIHGEVYGKNDIGERMDMLNDAIIHKSIAIATYTLAMLMLLVKIITL
jgi:hypothetical protein